MFMVLCGHMSVCVYRSECVAMCMGRCRSRIVCVYRSVCVYMSECVLVCIGLSVCVCV